MRFASNPLKQGIVILAICTAATASGVGAYSVKVRRQEHSVATAMIDGDPSRAPPLFRRYGCAGCHVIPGIPGADGKVGGPLQGLRGRVYIGGVVNNTPEDLVKWIVAPQRFSPHTAMPATGITERDARHLAAYLYAN